MEILATVVLLVVIAVFAFITYDATHQNKSNR